MKPEHAIQQPARAFSWRFILYTFAFSWVCWIAAIGLTPRGTEPGGRVLALIVLGSFGPTLAAFALHYHENGWLGVRRLLQHVRFRISAGVLLFIAIAPLAQSWLAHWLSGRTQMVLEPLSLIGNFFLYFFFAGPCGEEFGWRGYALERLQGRYGALVASLLIGVLWALWHLPLTRITGMTEAVTPFWVFLLGCLALSVTFTWVYNAAKANILAVLLLHTFGNITSVIFPYPTSGIDRTTYYDTALAVVLACIVLPWVVKFHPATRAVDATPARAQASESGTFS